VLAVQAVAVLTVQALVVLMARALVVLMARAAAVLAGRGGRVRLASGRCLMARLWLASGTRGRRGRSMRWMPR